MLEELQVKVTSSPDVPFLDADRTRTPPQRRWRSVAISASGSASAEPEPPSITGNQSYAEHYDQDFTADPDRVAVDEKQVQLKEERKVWLYAAIDVDSKVVLHARLSQNRGESPQ